MCDDSINIPVSSYSPLQYMDICAVIKSLKPMIKPHKRDYKNIKLINCGSFGKVHLVHHKDTKQTFAMKTLPRRDLSNPKLLKLIYLERDISIFADCPFVVPMFCSYPTKNHLCMVMEFAAGGDCDGLIKCNRPLPLSWARMYIAETVLAVEYLHSYGVVHRDLKPQNLLISSSGHIKVTDFGLSKLGLMRPSSNNYKAPIEDITREFLDTEVRGTRYYMAPEVILEKGYGRPVDWWSIGIILYQFLTGFLPFNGKSRNDVSNSILTDDITWNFGKYVPPPNAQDCIIELLRKNPAHRLGTGGANEIKIHPFLSDIDFENLQNQQPPYVPYFEDSCYDHFNRSNDTYSDKNNTSEDINWPEGRNFVSSSQRHSKLFTTNTCIMSNEDCKLSTDCLLETNTKHSDAQTESSPSGAGNDNQCVTSENMSSSSTLSESPFEKRSKSVENLSGLNLRKEQITEKTEQGEHRRGSIFRRMISSTRRGFSRAAHAIRESSLFSLCQRGTLNISKTEKLDI
ncbi:microtubule-associated serine/threonine-protein kinase 3-like [Anomaloglossus baeobatrachus]|uniref:microtubule-associated serine/threonine-protein kinase 3-like n=1 Tax=Anomaloglossus baeobatrachus TaxID=238106 RepID=UPI003F4F954C